MYSFDNCCNTKSLQCELIYVILSSRREEGLLLVQSENGSIGLVHEKNLDFSKRALQKRVR